MAWIKWKVHVSKFSKYYMTYKWNSSGCPDHLYKLGYNFKEGGQYDNGQSGADERWQDYDSGRVNYRGLVQNQWVLMVGENPIMKKSLLWPVKLLAKVCKPAPFTSISSMFLQSWLFEVNWKLLKTIKILESEPCVGYQDNFLYNRSKIEFRGNQVLS